MTALAWDHLGRYTKGIDNYTKVLAIKIINLEAAKDETDDIQQEITMLSV